MARNPKKSSTGHTWHTAMEKRVPKPYQRVKKARVNVCNKAGGREVATLQVWLDHRGKISFGIAVPREVGGYLMDRIAHTSEDVLPEDVELADLGLEPQSQSFYMVRAKTAEDAIHGVERAYSVYAAAYSVANRRDVIVLTFGGTAYRWSKDGTRGRELFRFGERFGHGGADVALQFSIERFWLIGKRNLYLDFGGDIGLRQRKFLDFDADNAAQARQHAKKGVVVLDYSEDLWNRLVQLRQVITDAAVRMREFLGDTDLEKRLLATAAATLLEHKPGK